MIIIPVFLFSNSFEYKLSYFEDNSALELSQIKTQQFTPIRNQYLNKGFNFNDFWIKIELINHSNKDLKKIFYLDNPTVDKLDLFENNKLKISTGDHREVSKREFNDIYFAFDLNAQKDTNSTYYLKINTTNAFVIKFYLEDHQTYQKNSNYKMMFLLFFAGFISSIIIYNIFLFTILKDKIYLYYVLFQITILMLLLSMSGLGIYLIWVDNFSFNEFILKTFDDLTIVLGVIFCKNFLNTKKSFPKLNKLINIVLLVLIYVMVTPWEYHSLLVKPVMIGSILLIILISSYAAIKNIYGARLFLFGWLILMVGAIVTLLGNFGEIDTSSITSWSLYIGSMLEAIIFSIALARKIEQLKQEKENALKISKKLLHKKVKQKTKRLNSMVVEKSLLLKELNHRIKNNLQIISSFITILSINEEDSRFKQSLNLLNDRIFAIASLHKFFYDQKHIENISIKKYFLNLIDNLKYLHSKETEISYNLNICEETLDIDKLTIIGIIINELITNSIKYAFECKKQGNISIILQKDIDTFTLKYLDDGIGFDMNKRFKSSIGINMIQRLAVKQLNADIKFEGDNGVYYQIVFKDLKDV